jgi:hypothetical protein
MSQTESKGDFEKGVKSAKNCGKITVVKMRIPMGAASRRKNFEIVFLPYKASMWDSLESIYLAAKTDPDCDAYVVPIPYYDRLPAGSFGEMHYEGNEYPDNIQITNYRYYNLEERRPDVIFIHNPYDGCNSVVSVDPRYYCSEIRRFTKMICYIPYFVSRSNKVQEHFILTAASYYAHKVILQSEEVRETYINTFKKEYGNKIGKAEDKFVALGSPKFDKVMSTKKEDCRIPEKWRKLIGDKKIVLYNTTVTAILKDGEQYLKKLQAVFAAFKERKEEILWWRPHPLSETTYLSMCPELLEEYRQIVESYKREDFGIYDDSADLHRAIAMSDLYYGDYSSVATLYHATQKPVVIQKVKVVGIETMPEKQIEVLNRPPENTNDTSGYRIYSFAKQKIIESGTL